ncbi:mCG1032870 [Mus musculus]|uniref:Uncharacterized protein n=1 Tax=Mus musculus TaxID=10090 RepID=Q8BH39_MOUSE|nr:mCG1032870 [Mus musculus]BAC36818.1 unnamed protein product [Mus musculus]BAC39946.1 unnamed protein product [Mus musculus]
MERSAGFLLNVGSSGGARKRYPNSVSLWQRKESSKTVYSSGLRNGAQSGVWVLGETDRGGKDVGAAPAFEAPRSPEILVLEAPGGSRVITLQRASTGSFVWLCTFSWWYCHIT